jgi:phosphoribosylformylglycinamidine synthase
MGKVKGLVITGFGLNCEAETYYVLERAGAEVEQVHLNDLIAGKRKLNEYHLVAFIGGFAFGDHISAGQVFANRFKCHLMDELRAFIAEGKLVIGICNGFQTLAKMGLLPGFNGDYETQSVTLGANDSGTFRDAWIRLKADPGTKCVFTRGIDEIELPIRHGEGKFMVKDESVLDRLRSQGQIVFRYIDPGTGSPTMVYPHNPNGSVDAVAGICDPSGRVFGLMPHPEAFHSPYNHPHWLRQKLDGRLPSEGAGMKIFKNAVEYLKESLGVSAGC